MPVNRRKWLALIASTLGAGCTTSSNPGTSPSSFSSPGSQSPVPPTDEHDPVVSAESGTIHCSLSADGAALSEFETLKVTFSKLVIREDGPLDECPDSTETVPVTKTPSQTPESVSDLDQLEFTLGTTIDFTDLSDSAAEYVGKFTVPSIAYTDAYLVVSEVSGQLESGEEATFREETSYFGPVANHELKFTLPAGGFTGMRINASVSQVDGDYVVLPREGAIGTDGSEPTGSPRFERGMYFLEPLDGRDSATVKVTDNGKLARGVVLQVNDEQYETGEDGTVTIDVPEPPCFDMVAFASDASNA